MTYYALLVSIVSLGTPPSYTELSAWPTRERCERLAAKSAEEMQRWSPDLDIRWECVERHDD